MRARKMQRVMLGKCSAPQRRGEGEETHVNVALRHGNVEPTSWVRNMASAHLVQLQRSWFSAQGREWNQKCLQKVKTQKTQNK